MKSESELQQLIQIEARKYGCLLMRNNSGALLDKDGRLVRYGLGNTSKQHNDVLKSSDLIGIRPTVITKEMVGQTIGVFTCVECKAEGWEYKDAGREKAQFNFIDLMKENGGIGGFAQSNEDLYHILKI